MLNSCRDNINYNIENIEAFMRLNIYIKTWDDKNMYKAILNTG